MRTDEELARAFGEGDDEALAELYDRYRRPLFVFCARMLGADEEARDAVQDLFAGAWARREGIASARCVRAWLFTLARNRCLNELRRVRDRARLAPRTVDPSPSPPASATFESEEDARQVRLALATLSPEHREVLILREYHELSYHEIAEITDASESAVKSRLFRARQALADRLRVTIGEEDRDAVR